MHLKHAHELVLLSFQRSSMSETLNMDLYFKKEYLQHTGRSVCSHYIICIIMLLLILFQVIFLFLLFLGMVMYASEVETTTKKNNNKIT